MITTKFTVGHYTRRHGTPLTYDIATQEGYLRFCSRIGVDCSEVDIRRYIDQIDALPSFLQQRHWVEQTRASLGRELHLRGAAV